MPKERAKEGPFVELIGTDIIRDQPIIEVSAITRREDAIYQALLPAGREHALLMGLPRELTIFEATSKHAEITGISMTPAGGGWLEVAISIVKRNQEQPLTVGLAALHGHSSLKSVIIVDEDVDVTNYLEVQKAIIQRSYPPEDYTIIKGARGSSLDHSNIRQVNNQFIKLPHAKIIIDATVKGKKEAFEKAKIPLKRKLEELLS